VSKTDITGLNLASGTSDFVDDADVGRPSHAERDVEVDDTANENVGGVRVCEAAQFSRPTIVHARPHEQRTIERRVVDPNADDNGRSHLPFQSISTDLLYSQKSTEQYNIIIGLDSMKIKLCVAIILGIELIYICMGSILCLGKSL